jgi:hypothetical protein
VDLDDCVCVTGLNTTCGPHGARSRQIAEDVVLDRIRRRAIGTAIKTQTFGSVTILSRSRLDFEGCLHIGMVPTVVVDCPHLLQNYARRFPWR